MKRLALILGTALLAACGADEERPAAPAAAPDSTRLVVEVTQAAKPVRFVEACGGARACDAARLRALRAALDDADDGTRACTQQFGGPERARVTGRLEGRRVDVELDRADGCAIAAYDALFAALDRAPPLG